MSGPRYCVLCGDWPGIYGPDGHLCHMCDCRRICREHPVPLPDNPEYLRDLAAIGVPGAADKLAYVSTHTQKEGTAP